MNRCATCTHWDKYDLAPDPEWAGKDDNVPGDLDPWGTCKAIAHDRTDYTDRVTDVIAYTYDGSNYTSGLSTRSSFGCVLHEAK